MNNARILYDDDDKRACEQRSPLFSWLFKRTRPPSNGQCHFQSSHSLINNLHAWRIVARYKYSVNPASIERFPDVATNFTNLVTPLRRFNVRSSCAFLDMIMAELFSSSFSSFLRELDAALGIISTPPVVPQKCWINILDVDSLLHIFKLATRNDQLPIALSHVCRQWRDIIRYTPTMWTYIKVRQTPRFNNHHFTQTLLRAQHALQRSGACAITVEICIRTPHMCPTSTQQNDHPSQDKPPQFSSHTQQLCALLVTHSARMKRLCIVANEPSLSDIQRSLAGVPMPLLVHCCVTNSDDSNHLRDHGSPVFLVCPNGVGDADIKNLYPKLNSLGIQATPLAWAQLPVRNLRTLTLAQLPNTARISASELRQVLLANEHALRDLQLPGGAPLESTAQYVMSNVRSLYLAYETPNELVPFLQSMKVPNLEELSLKDLTRASHSVRTLYQGRYDASIEVLVTALIDNLPLHNLTDLYLGWVRFLPYRRHLDKNAHEWIPNVHNLPIPAFLFRFMSLMTSLENLSMSDPDYSSLFSLNYHPRSTHQTGTDPMIATPVPMLSSLTLAAFNLRLVQKFIARRLVTVANPRPRLRELYLKMPKSWRSKLRFNMSLISQHTTMADVEFEDRGEESILMEPYE